MYLVQATIVCVPNFYLNGIALIYPLIWALAGTIFNAYYEGPPFYTSHTVALYFNCLSAFFDYSDPLNSAGMAAFGTVWLANIAAVVFKIWRWKNAKTLAERQAIQFWWRKVPLPAEALAEESWADAGGGWDEAGKKQKPEEK